MRGRVQRYLWALFPASLMLSAANGAMQAPQEPATKQKQEGTAGAKAYDPTQFLEFIKPRPLEPIPDNPPPHEGAMFELSYRIESPDLILVEVLEALPGRQITGERLVRPDGTISLQWYGELHVTGLTIDQVKVKVILHLRQFVTDEALGLIEWDASGREMLRTSTKDSLKGPLFPLQPIPALPPEDPQEFLIPTSPIPLTPTNPFQVPPVPGPLRTSPNIPGPPPQVPPAEGRTPPEQAAVEATKGAAPATAQPSALFRNAKRNPALNDPVPPGVVARDGPENQGAVPLPVPPQIRSAGNYVYVAPGASDRVFVDVSAYNSRVYYVSGDLASNGRLTWTGKETVLDAINFAGGFLPSADDANIRLYRPARGDKPAREYHINYRAILRGDHKANLQMFPGDRLIVGRKDPNVIFGAREGR
jgi:protein involved in polysaccharide export with SLBB domain